MQSQVKIDVNLGAPAVVTPVIVPPQVIVNPPVWGPSVTTQQYYFLPDIETYYDIRNSQYIYNNNGRWMRVKNLPRRYSGYNLNSGQVIVLNDYRGRSPYVNFKNHKVKFAKNGKNWNHDNGNYGGHKGNKGNHGNGKNKNK